jgi:hypothetical protein
MNIKFVWNGIKIDKKLHRFFYSGGKLIHYPEGTVTMYAKDYNPLPKIEGITVHNDSDMMTDYFEHDRIRITPDNKFYNDAKNALNLYEEHHAARHQKYIERSKEATK